MIFSNKAGMYTPDKGSIVKAILGPTNTGKTHYAVERMLARSSGVIGLPLRLLAREVYDKICAQKGARQCALVTGEEKIVPQYARYYVCTVEAMPTDREFAFVAIDEVQLMNNPERGHVFTDRVLNMRGTQETLLLGAETVRPILRDLLPDIEHDTRDRFSTLTYAGPTKLTRLPKRSVIVAFSAPEVYAIAELIRRFRGGAAIVMGALSPRTRNAQAELYQSGEVDFLVATDAVGMGLNLDTDHVAFASMRKFDGRRRRKLTPMEAGQIAGRAGRFRNNGTFGTTGDCPPMDDDLVGRIENHTFEPFRHAEWRNTRLNYVSVEALLDSLAKSPPHKRLRRVALPDDEAALEKMIEDRDVLATLKTERDIKLLWDVCQIPDFRNMTIDSHVRLLSDVYAVLMQNNGKLTHDFLNKRISRLDHTEGDVDILAVRLAQIRTWTYCANKTSWMIDPERWIQATRAVEDRLSDALHERLTARFVDRRTSALLKGIGRGEFMETSIKDDGEVWLGDHKIGHLEGLAFKIDASGSELEAKALQAAAEKSIGPEINRRLTSICAGQHAIFTLSDAGEIMWGGVAIGRVSNGGTIFNPDAKLIGGEMGDPNLCALAEDRMRDYLRGEVSAKLSPLLALKALSENESPETIAEARGFAYQLLERDGHMSRSEHYKTIKALEPDARRQLRDVGVVFGQYDVFMHELIKPKPATLLSVLAAFGAGGDKTPFIPFAGVTSLASEGEFASEGFTSAAIFRSGYRACGPRIVRFDILNRLAALIRQAQSQADKQVGGRRFQIMLEMLALLGCTYEDMRGVLTALGYQSETIETVVTDQKESQATTSHQTKVATASKTDEIEDKKPSEPPTKEAKQADVKSDASQPLNVFQNRETDEAGETTTIENREYWFMPRRSAPKGRKRHQKAGQFKGRKGPSKRKSDTRGTPGGSKPRKEPMRVEDSPFAALAALKGQMSQDNKKDKKD